MVLFSLYRTTVLLFFVFLTNISLANDPCLDGLKSLINHKKNNHLESFILAMKNRDYSHPLLLNYSTEYIERMEKIISKFNEWQKHEILFIAFNNLQIWKDEIARKGLSKLGKTKKMTFPDGSTVPYDPRKSELYWYGYPQVGLRDVDTFKQYIDNYSANSIMTSPYKSGGLDGGYDVEDMFSVSRKFGGNKKYFEYIDKMNRDGGSVVHDFVLPHSSPKSKKLHYDNFLFRKTRPEIVDKECIGGSCYVTYRDAETNATWKIELDDANQSGVHYAPFITEDAEMVYSMHYFKDNQFVLNSFNPSTWEHYFSSVGFWLSKGVAAMRLDAVFFLANRDGIESIGNKSSEDMIELIQLFAQGLRPGVGVLNEAVGGLEIAKKYIGKTIEVAGTKMASKGNMDFGFELSSRLRFGMVLEDFSGLYDTFQRLKNIEYPEDYFSLLFTSTHDHEPHGFLSDHQWSMFRKMVVERNGIANYSEPNSAIRNADLFKRDPSEDVNPKRMKMLFKAFLGLGNTAIYYGDEFGKRTDLAFAYKMAEDQLKLRKELIKQRLRAFAGLEVNSDFKDLQTKDFIATEGALIERERDLLEKATIALKNQNKTVPPVENSILYKTVFDPRWAKRGDITVDTLKKYMRGDGDKIGQQIFNSLKLLKEMRSRTKALFLKHDTDWLDTFRSDIGSWVSRYYNPQGVLEEEVAVLINSQDKATIVEIPDFTKLTRQNINVNDLRLFELEENRYLEKGQDFFIKDGKLQLNIPSDTVLWLRVDS